ncbi:MAG: uracil-DNA glycosylase family protein [Anaerolineales bacterium]
MKERSYHSLAEVQKKMDRCRLCLKQGYEIFPPAVYAGNPKAEMMIIGQAPGITEQEAGRPFNAGSGTRLFCWLEGAGIEESWFRTMQYMTSVTKCYPGRQTTGGGDRVPSKAERDLCQPYLEHEIQFVDPKVVLPVGRVAINLYFPSRLNLTEIVGREKEIEGRWIVPLPHSSGASRWHQITSNRRLISQAVALIKDHKDRLF